MMWIGILGGFGVLSRYFIDTQLSKVSSIPWPTLTINCIGSFLMGVLFVFGALSGLLSRELSVPLAVGFLGGFTTFSAFSIQTFQLLADRHLLSAALNLFGSPALGLASAYLGVISAKFILNLH